MRKFGSVSAVLLLTSVLGGFGCRGSKCQKMMDKASADSYAACLKDFTDTGGSADDAKKMCDQEKADEDKKAPDELAECKAAPDDVFNCMQEATNEPDKFKGDSACATTLEKYEESQAKK